MKLIIHRFKCHVGVAFEFEQAQVCGPSGAGKSTLLQAIQFAITGALDTDVGEDPRVELIGEFYLARSLDSLQWNDIEGPAAQEHIDAYFHFNMGKSVEDILFPPGRPKPEELSRRCDAEIRALDSRLDQLKGSLSVLERDIGAPPPKLLDAAQYLYLKNKQFLYNSYVQKVALLEQELQSLQCEIVQAVPLTAPEDELRRQVFAEDELARLNWTQFTTYSVQDCREMVAEYSADIELARAPYNPEQHQQLQREYDNMCVALLPCPACEATLALRNNRLFRAAPDCKIVPPREVAECKAALEECARRAGHERIEESPEFLAEQLEKWREYLGAAQTIERLRPHLRHENARKQLHYIERGKFVQERMSTLIQWIEALHKAAADINLVDYSSLTAFDVDRYKELQLARGEAEKVRRRKAAAEQLQNMISRTQKKYEEAWLAQVEARINILCAFVLDDFTVRLSRQGAEISNRGLKMTPDMLSSGEFARYDLCHTIAVAEQCNSKILLLDEVLVHLDADSRERTVRLIRTTVKCAMLLVSHDGAFLEKTIALQ